ncbi:MAG: nucleoside 2-deoxyribosyltransferase [Methanoregulaceae archaeon]
MRANTPSMYVLACPCILDPSLRARGITRDADRAAFFLALERCRKFGIEAVPLPCPETRYLGKDRKPGTFLERLNTPEFRSLQQDLAEAVRKIIAERGSPLCIIGVDSSPSCGVTATHFGTVGGSSPKRPGRGSFLSLLADIPAIDVKIFARYRIYLAAPLFSEAERTYNRDLGTFLTGHYFEVFLPQDAGDDSSSRTENANRELFEKDLAALRAADLVVAVIDGADADSGTAWEMGYAFSLGKPVIAIRTDFRMAGHHERVNLMLEMSSVVVGSKTELLGALLPLEEPGVPAFSGKVPDYK